MLRRLMALTVIAALLISLPVVAAASSKQSVIPPPFPCGGVVREMHILAVAEAGGKYFGVPTLLRVVVTPGTGEVFLSTEPLTEVDMQASARLAALVAAYVAGKNYFNYDYFISIISNSTIVGGPSAGAAITVAIVSALLNKPINESVVETGMIMPDGTIGPVGGIPEKLHAAAEVHAKVMLIPAGQRIAYSLAERRYVDVVSLGKELGVKVVQVSTIYDALHWFGINIPRPPKAVVKLPPTAVEVIKGWINRSRSVYLKIRPKAEEELLKAPQVSDVVREYMSKAREYFINGLRDLKLREYYSAASDFFASDIYVDTAYWIAAIAAGNASYSQLLNLAKKELSKALSTYSIIKNEIMSEKYVDIAKLSIAVEIASRALDANQTYHSLPSTILSYDTIFNAVYAYWRAKTVMDWSKMFKAIPKSGIMVSTSSIKRHAALLTYFATTSASYIESLIGQQSAVNKVLNMASKARELLDTDYLAALAEAMRASAYASAMLNTAFTTNIGGTADRLRNAALEAAGEAIARGFDPIVALSYIERGNSLRGIDDTGAVYFYDLALINTMWYLIISGNSHSSLKTHAVTTTSSRITGSVMPTRTTSTGTAGSVTESVTKTTASVTKRAVETPETPQRGTTSTAGTPVRGSIGKPLTSSGTESTVTINASTSTVSGSGGSGLLSNGMVLLAVAVGVGALLGAVVGALLSRGGRSPT